MLVTIALCDFFFDGDPEFILFMLYLVFSLLGSFLKSTAFPPAFAPHLLDRIAHASATAISSASEASSSSATTTTTTMVSEAARPLLRKYCGKTLGETAATCGLAVAWTNYFDPELKLTTVKVRYPNKRTTTNRRGNSSNDQRLKHLWSEAYGRFIDFRYGVDRWWETFEVRSVPSSLRQGSAETGARLQRRWKELGAYLVSDRPTRDARLATEDTKRAAEAILHCAWTFGKDAWVELGEELGSCFWNVRIVAAVVAGHGSALAAAVVEHFGSAALSAVVVGSGDAINNIVSGDDHDANANVNPHTHPPGAEL